jgi:hypothetical protein
LREEHRLRVSENRVLRRIFGSKREEVTREWRKHYNEELLTKYYTGDQIEKNEMDGEFNAYGGEERSIQGFGGKTQGKETTWKTQA